MGLEKYRHKIEIQKRDEDPDSAGDLQANSTWSKHAKPYAEVDHSVTSGSEEDQDEIVRAELDATFTTRWWHNHGVTTQMRIKYDGSTYNIISVEDSTGERKELIMEAEKQEAH